MDRKDTQYDVSLNFVNSFVAYPVICYDCFMYTWAESGFCWFSVDYSVNVMSILSIVPLCCYFPFRFVNICFICLGGIHIYKCYILLLDWPLYHYILSFFVSCRTVVLYNYPSFLWFPFMFIPSLLVYVLWHLKWISCRRHSSIIWPPFLFTLCFLIVEFISLTFEIIVDIYCLTAILFIVF